MQQALRTMIVMCTMILAGCFSMHPAIPEDPLPPQVASKVNGDLILTPISNLRRQSWDRVWLDIWIQGAAIARLSDWPASFVSESPEKCTSTLVGPFTLLTAAHCVKDGGTVQIPNLNATGTCARAPDYVQNHNETADWALCRMSYPGNQAPQIPYERLNSQAESLREGGSLLLTGFGCHDAFFTTDDNYRVGKSTIHSLPSGSNNFVEMQGGAVVCFGDSGGPTFLLLGLSENGPRRLAAVNSKRSPIPGVSSLASVTTQSAKDFIKDWSTRNGASICGFTPGATGCRN